MKRQTLALCLLFAAITAVVVDAARLGGWRPIKDLNDPIVKEIAEFAIDEHNKQAKSSLKLEKIVKGDEQVVSGKNYRLVLAVKNGKVDEKYQAVVYDKPWEHVRSLTSFVPYNV